MCLACSDLCSPHPVAGFLQEPHAVGGGKEAQRRRRSKSSLPIGSPGPRCAERREEDVKVGDAAESEHLAVCLRGLVPTLLGHKAGIYKQLKGRVKSGNWRNGGQNQTVRFSDGGSGDGSAVRSTCRSFGTRRPHGDSHDPTPSSDLSSYQAHT